MANASNLLILTGRLVKDPEVRQGKNGKNFCTATVAVQRNFKNAEGNYDSDFFDLLVGSNQAEFVEKFFHKGDPISIVGSLRNTKREIETKDGSKKYTFNTVNVEAVNFVPGAQRAAAPATQAPAAQGSFEPLPTGGFPFGEGGDEGIPF